MEQLRHLQLIILDIAKDIDLLCEKNRIKYYLLGGSTIGAIRHKGFIPWDDDLDIIMDHENYNKFVKVCREQLDHDKYCFQEGIKDWPLPFSKIRLRGTVVDEFEGYQVKNGEFGIWIDVFKFDNVSNNRFVALWQYFCAKLFLCYTLSERTYKSATSKKKMMIFLSKILSINYLKRVCLYQVERLNNRNTDYVGFFYGRTKLKNAILKKCIYGNPVRVPFEDTFLPVQERVKEYLTITFGDYMKLPPEKERVGLHARKVDFGEY